jgi:hypothetical protein
MRGVCACVLGDVREFVSAPRSCMGPSRTALPGGDARGCARKVGMPVFTVKLKDPQNDKAGCTHIDEGCGTCKSLYQHGTKTGFTQWRVRRRDATASVPARSPKARYATATRRPGATRGVGFAVLTNDLRGPGGEDVDEEVLDAVKSRGSKGRRGSKGPRGIRVAPRAAPLHGCSPSLATDGVAPADSQPHPLLLPFPLDVSGGSGLGFGEESPARLGFGVLPRRLLIGGGR